MSLSFPSYPSARHPLRPVRLFLDTEFTHFGTPGKSDARLLSIALIDEEGRSFYAECTGWQPQDCSDFVRSHVLPVLDHTPEDVQDIAHKLYAFLSVYDHVVVHCDYPGDWHWLLWLLAFGSKTGDVWPGALHHEAYFVDTRDWSGRARQVAQQSLQKWFGTYTQHHALNDANGLRYAWVRTCAALGWVDDPGSIRTDYAEPCFA